jgi:hypothetical protein
MMRGLGKAVFAAVLLLGIGAPVAAAGHALTALVFAPESGVSMKLISSYESIPPCGYLPLRVEVKNGGSAKRQWTLNSSHGRMGFSTVSFTTELEVDAHSERTFELLVPLVTQGDGVSRFSNLRVQITGYAVLDGSSALHSSGPGGRSTPYLGMGEELSVKNWGLLQEAVRKGGSRELDGTTLDSRMLPSDWRGLAGFQIIIFTSREWRAIIPASRAALLDWVAQGGKLLLGYDGANGPADLPPQGGLGAGIIEHWGLDGDLVSRLGKLLDGGSPSLAESTQQSYSWKWKPAAEIGRPEPPKLMILLFVIAFAVIVGPVNFFVFAPGVHRARLFWTTPLISVVASVLMALFILFSEGFGGRGRAFVTLLTLADQNKAVVWQEQVSRTGVLLGSSFTPSDPEALLLPIRLSDGGSAFVPGTVRQLALANGRWSGDWFRSRRTQAQLLLSVGASRGQLTFETAADGSPTAVSTFDREMEDLWYFDASGQAWTAGKIAPGEKVFLQRGQKSEFDQYLNRTLVPAGPLTRERVQDFAKSELAGKFFAAVPEPSLIATLPAIRWKDAEGIVFGRTMP